MAERAGTVNLSAVVPGQLIVLLIGDQPRVTDLIATGLRANGFVVHIAPNSIDLDLVSELDPDLIVMERLTSPPDSTEWPLEPSDVSQPLVVIGRDGVEEVDHALDRGVASYIARPQRDRELASRLRAIARRGRQERAEGPLTAGDLLVDLTQGTATVGGRRVKLARRDLLLLAALVAKVGRVVTYPELADRAWGADRSIGPRVITEQVRRIRARIEDAPGNPERVLTVRGLGYRLVPR